MFLAIIFLYFLYLIHTAFGAGVKILTPGFGAIPPSYLLLWPWTNYFLLRRIGLIIRPTESVTANEVNKYKRFGREQIVHVQLSLFVHMFVLEKESSRNHFGSKLYLVLPMADSAIVFLLWNSVFICRMECEILCSFPEDSKQWVILLSFSTWLAQSMCLKKNIALIIKSPGMAILSFLSLGATNLEVLPVEKLHKANQWRIRF